MHAQDMEGDRIFAEFRHYLELSNEMVDVSSKEALVRTARILAMQAAHYAAKYGDAPLIELEALLLSGNSVNPCSAAFLRDGARTFVGVLGMVTGGLERDSEDTIQ